MNVITLLNEKGGVGKTTTATHIAAGLAIHGQRVVLIDADAQGHSTATLALKKGPQFHDLIVREAEWSEILQAPSPDVWAGEDGYDGELYVVPSDVETGVIPLLVKNALLLRERLEDIEGWADIVVIDTSPTPSLLHSMVYLATTHMIHPTECEMLSLNGLNESIEHLEELNNLRESMGMAQVPLLGVQPTKYDVRTNAHDYGLSLLTKKFKRQAWPALPMRTIWRDAGFARRLLFSYRPDHVASVEAWAMVDRVERGLAATS